MGDANSELEFRAQSLNSLPPQVDHKAISHIALQPPLIGIVNLADVNFLNLAGNVAARAKIEQFLSLRNSTNKGSGKLTPGHDQTGGTDRHCLRRDPNQRKHAVASQQTKAGVKVMLCRDR